jgi:hypothetical protein
MACRAAEAAEPIPNFRLGIFARVRPSTSQVHHHIYNL